MFIVAGHCLVVPCPEVKRYYRLVFFFVFFINILNVNVMQSVLKSCKKSQKYLEIK